VGKAKKAKKALKSTKAKSSKKSISKVRAVGLGAKAVSGLVGKAVSGFKGKRGGGGGFPKRVTAKQRLKKAYEKRALYKIRSGNLGGARKDLRKKATVI